MHHVTHGWVFGREHWICRWISPVNPTDMDIRSLTAGGEPDPAEGHLDQAACFQCRVVYLASVQSSPPPLNLSSELEAGFQPSVSTDRR